MKLHEVDAKYIDTLKANEKRLRAFLKSQKLGKVSYFSFARLYDSDEAVILGTNGDLILNRISHNSSLHFDPPREFLKANCVTDLMLVDQNSPEIIRKEHSLFGCGHSVYFFHFHKEYYDVFCFSLDGISERECKWLFGLQKTFSHVCNDFLLRYAGLIEKAETLFLPGRHFSRFRRRYYTSKTNLYVRENEQSISLPPRELESMLLYCDAYQAKEAARVMGIHPRTYKGYLHNVTQKVGGAGNKIVKVARENHLI